jgi:predicted molibdopterin-dependent oxidoreductase YjgC
VCDGEVIRATSRHGMAELPLHIDDRVKDGELFATFHTSVTGVNHLTGQGRDTQAMTPEYKVVAVRVETMEGGCHRA